MITKIIKRIFVENCVFLFVHTYGIWKFLAQGSNLCHSSNPSHCSDNARSLTSCPARELQIIVFLMSSLFFGLCFSWKKCLRVFLVFIKWYCFFPKSSVLEWDVFYSISHLIQITTLLSSCNEFPDLIHEKYEENLVSENWNLLCAHFLLIHVFGTENQEPYFLGSNLKSTTSLLCD